MSRIITTLAVSARALTLTVVCLLLANVTFAQPSGENFYARNIDLGTDAELQSNIFAFDVLLSEDPDNVPARYLRARAYFELEKYHRATIDLDHIVFLESENVDALELRAESRFALADFDAALYDYRAVLRLQDNYRNRMNVGLTQLAASRPDEALQTFRSAQHLAANSAEVHTGMADAFFMKGKAYYRQALSYYNRALLDEPHYTHALTNRAKLAYRTGNIDDAVRDLEKVVLMEASYEAYLKLAHCRLEQGEWADAETLVYEAAKLNDEDAELYYTQGMIETIKGDCESAAANFYVTKGQDPDYAPYVLATAEAFIGCKNYDEAAPLLAEYLQMVGEDDYAQKLLADCWVQFEAEIADPDAANAEERTSPTDQFSDDVFGN